LQDLYQFSIMYCVCIQYFFGEKILNVFADVLSRQCTHTGRQRRVGATIYILGMVRLCLI